jgi:hypothetical protein
MNTECDHYGFLHIGIDFAIPFFYTCSCVDGQGQGTPALDENQIESVAGGDIIDDIPIGHTNPWLDAQFPPPVHFIWDIDPASSNHGGSDAESGWTTDEPDSDQSDSDESFSSLPDLGLA